MARRIARSSVRATTKDGVFELSVANSGAPIPQDALKRLFQPFYRVAENPGQGLGLGLYIAFEIARAHGGKIDVGLVAGGNPLHVPDAGLAKIPSRPLLAPSLQ